jgi:hypothetical protein
MGSPACRQTGRIRRAAIAEMPQGRWHVHHSHENPGQGEAGTEQDRTGRSQELILIAIQLILIAIPVLHARQSIATDAWDRAFTARPGFARGDRSVAEVHQCAPGYASSSGTSPGVGET